MPKNIYIYGILTTYFLHIEKQYGDRNNEYRILAARVATLNNTHKQVHIIGSDNGLSPGCHHAIIWTNAGILLIRTFETNLSEILSKIHTFLFKKMSAGKLRPFCPSMCYKTSLCIDVISDSTLCREWL